MVTNLNVDTDLLQEALDDDETYDYKQQRAIA
jgi:hypothetical protein